ncbi:MAG: GlsB/YeaQ/YmgE family stress response membrane protein [Chloroflexota bacterium]
MVPQFAAASLQPGSILVWLLVGLIAGWAASALMGRGGYGVVGDVIIGLVGAVIGGFVVSLFVGNATYGFWGSLVVSILGACLLIALLRALSPGRAV